MPIAPTATLGDLVTEDSRRSRILEKFGLDYCCHGQHSLADAVTSAGLDLDAVIAALSLPDDVDRTPTDTPRASSDLAHDIVDTHHAYMWAEMPRLAQLVEKVYRVHGQRHPELTRVHDAFVEAVAALEPHMTTEERSVFPAISMLEKGRPTPLSGSLPESIDRLVAEHHVVGKLFGEMRTLTDGYTWPADGCASYKMMLEGLQQMELDLHEHIHKENNILFPAALKLAES